MHRKLNTDFLELQHHNPDLQASWIHPVGYYEKQDAGLYGNLVAPLVWSSRAILVLSQAFAELLNYSTLSTGGTVMMSKKEEG